jgi:azurin
MLRGTNWFIRRSFVRGGVLAVTFLLLLVACGGGASTPVQPTATSPSPTQPAAASNATLLEIGTSQLSDEFKYDKESLEAPTGSKIMLKFNNNTKPADEIGHNWVLVKPGQEDSVLANGITAGDDNDWLDVNDPGIIAYTRLIEGSESDTITFDAPAPGTYTYLCTFPEHAAGGQRGTLTIK